jgi:hypothetical protein
LLIGVLFWVVEFFDRKIRFFRKNSDFLETRERMAEASAAEALLARMKGQKMSNSWVEQVRRLPAETLQGSVPRQHYVMELGIGEGAADPR